jgi:crotonobetainyl-CoA:carnitine CoA-transferase CaiB-like acyl-CoA transferase
LTDRGATNDGPASEGPDGALAGLRVLDLTRNLAGPFCTMVLGEFGANVTKIESPRRGDDTREWAPFTDTGESSMFQSANRNKRSVCVDLDTADGAAIITELARKSDILVESFKPGALDRRHLGWDNLSQANPGLIYCSVSAYGAVGPKRGEPGYDPVIQAATGIMSITGDPEGAPARLGIGAVDLGAGLWAVVGILLALAERKRTERGSRVDTSLFETAAWWLSYHLAGYLATGVVPQRYGSASPAIAPYEAFRTQQGELFIAAGNDDLFRTLCDALELRELLDDSRFATNPLRVKHVEELRSALSTRLASKTADEWEQILQRRNLPCSRVATVAEFASDPQLAALELLQGLPGVSQDALRFVATPLTIDGARAKPKLAPPRLGEHTTAVLQELDFSLDEIESLRARGVVR